jgi:hypothetical protein
MTAQPRRRVAVDAMPWRPLLSDPGAEWQQLSSLTRGIAAEVMRRLDKDRAITCAAGRSVADAVCMAIAAHPKERGRVAKAISELEAGRWVTLSEGRLVAYFPDLNVDRPEPQNDRSGVGDTTETPRSGDGQASERHRSGIGAATDSPRSGNSDERKSSESPESQHGSRVEKSRVEESREDACARDPDPPGELGREVGRLQRAIKAELGDRGAPANLTGSDWSEVATWCRSMVTPTRSLADVHAHLARGFASDPKAAKAGWSPRYLATNPNEYFNRVIGASGVPRAGYVTPADASEHVETSDEEFEFALRGGAAS